MKKGDAIFINSNTLHDIRISNGARECKIYAHLFDMHFLTGMYNSIFEQNYVLPILRCRELQTYTVSPNTYRRIRMLDTILKTIGLNEKETFGYEFEIRAELCRFWCMLMEETETIRRETSEKNDHDISRIKVMMQYIHKHYSERLTLADIARTANISSRESIRCFQRSIGMAPINYLNDYRIREAAKMLLQTNDSIMDIGEKCGFSSNSYFGKVFRESLGCTPKEYRNKKLI